ncbi:hypothetical protein QQ045_012379 [Rhodiola kirilowii]
MMKNVDFSGLEPHSGKIDDLASGITGYDKSFQLPSSTDFDGFVTEAIQMVKPAKGTTTLAFIFLRKLLSLLRRSLKLILTCLVQWLAVLQTARSSIEIRASSFRMGNWEEEADVVLRVFDLDYIYNPRSCCAAVLVFKLQDGKLRGLQAQQIYSQACLNHC